MEFPHRATVGNNCEHRTQAGELITELTLLVEQPGDQLTADLACRDLAAVLDVCDDPALAADGDELIVQVFTLRRSAASVEQRMPLAS